MLASEAQRIALLEDEKQKLKEALEEAQERIERNNKKNKQLKDRLIEAEERFKKVVDYNLKVFKSLFSHLRQV